MALGNTGCQNLGEDLHRVHGGGRDLSIRLVGIRHEVFVAGTNPVKVSLDGSPHPTHPHQAHEVKQVAHARIEPEVEVGLDQKRKPVVRWRQAELQ